MPEQKIVLVEPSTPMFSLLTLTFSPSAPDFITKFSSGNEFYFSKVHFSAAC
jgi:hypothetical protein